MSEQSSIVTLFCDSEIVVDCFYKDYDNAPWDSSIKDYAYVDTINIREKHNAKFGCRLEINRIEKDITLFPFLVVLGGDSRKQRYKVIEPESRGYEQDYYNTERKELMRFFNSSLVLIRLLCVVINICPFLVSATRCTSLRRFT